MNGGEGSEMVIGLDGDDDATGANDEERNKERK